MKNKNTYSATKSPHIPHANIFAKRPYIFICTDALSLRAHKKGSFFFHHLYTTKCTALFFFSFVAGIYVTYVVRWQLMLANIPLAWSWCWPAKLFPPQFKRFAGSVINLSRARCRTDEENKNALRPPQSINPISAKKYARVYLYVKYIFCWRNSIYENVENAHAMRRVGI